MSAWTIIRGRLIMLYWMRWGFRDLLKVDYGVKARQTDDLFGVILPNGRYISYGKQYHRAYFAGRIL